MFRTQNGKTPIEPKFFTDIRKLDEGTSFGDSDNYSEISDTISSILGKESPISLFLLYSRVRSAYKGEKIDDETLKSVTDKVISESKNIITESLLRGKIIVWSHSKNIENNDSFREYKILKNDTDIGELSEIEVKNALTFWCFNDIDDNMIIRNAFQSLGYSSVPNEVYEIADAYLKEIKNKSSFKDYYDKDIENDAKKIREEKAKSRSRSVGGTIGSNDASYVFVHIPKVQKISAITPYFVPLEYKADPLYWKVEETEYHITIGFYYLRNPGSIDLIVNELMNTKDVMMSSPIVPESFPDSDEELLHKRFGFFSGCEDNTMGYLSFKTFGIHPVDVFRNVLNKVLTKYKLNAEFTHWEPFIGKEPTIPEECVRYSNEADDTAA